MIVRFSSLLALGFVVLASGCAAPPQSFNSPDEAVDALIAAARSDTRDPLKAVLGGDAEDVLTSGDPVADRQAIDDFLSRYEEAHQLVTEPDGSVSLAVGHNQWPMPIPIVQNDSSGTWHFDVEQGKEEIVNRRIGRNELNAIEVCRAIVDAQHEYATLDPDGDGVREYAHKFLSDPGSRNGLFWPTDEGEPPSPLGPLVVEATNEGYTRSTTGEPQPYHGYYYRMLTAQGPYSFDGARSFLVDGRMTGGFAAVAYPAEHGESGIMSFIVNHDGIVFERDLGRDTVRQASSMTEYDRSPEWTAVTPVN